MQENLVLSSIQKKIIKEDIIGKRYFNVVVEEELPDRIRGARAFVVRCDCGGIRHATYTDIRLHRVKSCGCKAHDSKFRHGAAQRGKVSREYKIWAGIIERCLNPNSKDSANYSERGIMVCDEWRDFINFYRDMGVSPSNKHSIDRIDNNKGYSPENCRWAVAVDQCNNKRTNRFITHNGKTMTHANWARELGIPRTMVNHMVAAGKSMSDIIEYSNRWKQKTGR